MSYLYMPKADLPDMKSGIISFWVRARGIYYEDVPRDVWKTEWLPPHLDQSFKPNQAAYGGASYWATSTVLGLPIDPCRVKVRPPGIPVSYFDSGQDLITFRDRFTPFITFGDPKQKYKRSMWKTQPLDGPPIWIYLMGGVPQVLVADYPTEGPEEENIVPPSMIGFHHDPFGQGLRIILQTKDRATYGGFCWTQKITQRIHIMTPYTGNPFITGGDVVGYKDFSKSGALTPPNQNNGYNIIYEDVSMLECAGHPEAFVMDTGVNVLDDKWHHVLIAFEFGDGGETGKGGGTAAPAPPPPAPPPPAPGTRADAPPPTPTDTPSPGKPTSTGSGSGAVSSEATGPPGRKPYPGTWGQYPGPSGDRVLGVGGVPPEGYTGGINFGEPYEECGEFGLADGGKISSKCKAYVVIDDKIINGKQLNHRTAWNDLVGRGGQTILDGLDKHAILPPNAFCAPFSECRQEMKTQGTFWEREYRTYLGKYTGPSAIIDITHEPRRYDYQHPKYDFTPTALPTQGHPIGIPAGPDMVNRIQGLILAELQIWSNPPSIPDFNEEENRRLFIAKHKDTGELKPASMRKAAEKFGKPHIRLHGTGNWRSGYNTGSIGVKIVDEGTPKQKTEKIPEGQFEPTGKIDRYRPDPRIKGPPAPKPKQAAE